MTKENELTPFTFKDTGKQVLTRHVSPMLIYELRKAFPPPEPPMQEVDYDGQKIMEANFAHPDYALAMRDYQTEFKDKVVNLLVKRGAIINWTDEMKAELEDLRKFWLEEYNKELPGNDSVAWIQYICVGTTEDLDEFVEYVTRRSQPTEAAIAEAAKFSGGQV